MGFSPYLKTENNRTITVWTKSLTIYSLTTSPLFHKIKLMDRNKLFIWSPLENRAQDRYFVSYHWYFLLNSAGYTVIIYLFFASWRSLNFLIFTCLKITKNREQRQVEESIRQSLQLPRKEWEGLLWAGTGRGRVGEEWKKNPVEKKITFDCQMEILKLNLMLRTFIWNMNVNLKSCSVDFRSWRQPSTMVSNILL